MRNYALVAVIAITLAGCAASAPVISDIREDQVKVVMRVTGSLTDAKTAEVYTGVLEKAIEGCALHGREAVEISVSSRSLGRYGMETEYEYLFACVEEVEEAEQDG